MVHVWHLFHPELPEAQIALERIASFLAKHGCNEAPAATPQEALA